MRIIRRIRKQLELHNYIYVLYQNIVRNYVIFNILYIFKINLSTFEHFIFNFSNRNSNYFLIVAVHVLQQLCGRRLVVRVKDDHQVVEIRSIRLKSTNFLICGFNKKLFSILYYGVFSR